MSSKGQKANEICSNIWLSEKDVNMMNMSPYN